MQLYKDLLETVLNKGKRKPSGRDIADTISYFNWNGEMDMADGFPLLTTKKMPFKSIVRELEWFLSGKTSIKGYDLKFWEPWADENGNVPSAYGYYWRNYPAPWYKRLEIEIGEIESYIDQLREVIDSLKENPYSRRAVVLAWEPGNALNSKLPPCHYTFVFNAEPSVHNDSIFFPYEEYYAAMQSNDKKIKDAWKLKLNLHLTQRSGDIPIGIPFNWASYSLLLHIVVNQLGMIPGKFAHTIIDAHIYENQIELVKEQLTRDPYPLPQIELDPDTTIDNFNESKVKLIGYEFYPKIDYPVEV